MENGDDDVFEPAFDPAKFRTHVAAFVKSLIRARWKHEPGFMTPAQLERWELKSIEQDKQTAWRNMQHAALQLAVLARNFIPFGPSGGLPLLRGATPVEILIEEVGFLVPGCGGDPDHNQELVDATAQLRANHHIDWASLVEWARLDVIRDLLDRLPSASHGQTQGDDSSNRFYWDGGNWVTQYQGSRLNSFPGLDGFFYIWALLCEPQRHKTASALLKEKARFDAARETCKPEDFFTADNGDHWQSAELMCEQNSKQDVEKMLKVLRHELAVAQNDGAYGKAEELKREIAELERQFKNSTWRGREQTEADRIKKNDLDKVRSAKKRAIKLVRDKDQNLGDFLEGAIEIGPLCFCRSIDVSNWTLSKI